MDAFPAFFPLAGRKIVIAGSGDAAEAKARLFAGSPAQVVRAEGEAAVDPAAYAGAALAFIAGGDAAFRRAALTAAKANGVPVNVVDHPELCDFTTPAVIDRGEVVAAVGTGGAAPLLAALLRRDIEARVPEGAGRIAALLRNLQDEVRAALPDIVPRRAFLKAVLEGPAARAAMAGEMEDARRLLRSALADHAAGRPAGRVCAIAHGGPADLVSLRAARRLAEADVLVFGPAVGRDVAELARRDARRIDPADADLLALAGEGLCIVVVPPPSAAALQALGERGVEVEILASAPAAP
ncbi:MAG: NAD(P)-dependent oxidoreductase [Caulobacteraceae bacterium]|nr:NAD(P)-dependent oxidoreductase [Caulobacteraceae bacterium]